MGRIGEIYRGYWTNMVEEHEAKRHHAMNMARLAKFAGDMERMREMVGLAKSHHQTALMYRGFIRSKGKRQ